MVDGQAQTLGQHARAHMIVEARLGDWGTARGMDCTMIGMYIVEALGDMSGGAGCSFSGMGILGSVGAVTAGVEVFTNSPAASVV